MEKQRILGYDLARSLAIFGMVFVNFKVVMHASPEAGHEWLSIFNFLDGRASSVFVVLAGIGVSLMSNKARLSGDAKRYRLVQRSVMKRALFLFIFGLSYIAIWPADILHFYGIYMLFGVLLLSCSPKVLLTIAALLSIVFTMLFFTLNYGEAWDWTNLSYADFWQAQGFLRNLFFNGFHPFFPWAGFFLIGLMLGRLNMHNAQTRWRIAVWSVCAIVAAELLSYILKFVLGNQGWDAESIAVLTSVHPMPPLPVYFLSASGSACFLIVMCVVMGDRFCQARWLTPLVNTGQLALSLYLGHVIVGMGALEAMGMLHAQSMGFSVFSATIFCAAAIIFSHAWRHYFAQGPIEWLMRKVTMT
ncbi:MAG: DUF418 domain-containing protein [Burkholderiales bacterium]|nr:DUF418 domain-containing protein [Burkholderiales bacterium]